MNAITPINAAKRTFSFTTCTYRGRNEREFDWEVEYTFDGDEVRVTSAKCAKATNPTDEEWNRFDDEAANRADQDYADWLADYGEYLRDQQLDREAA